MSVESLMSSNHLILCCPLLLLPSVFSSISVFSNESALSISGPNVLELQLQHRSFPRLFREGREEGSPAVRIRLPSFRARQLPKFPFILFSFSDTETIPGEKEWKAQGQSLIDQVQVQKSLHKSISYSHFGFSCLEQKRRLVCRGELNYRKKINIQLLNFLY